MGKALLQTDLVDIGTPKRGKVRDIYDLEDSLLIVATDRLSAFDVVLPTGIDDKGKVLTQLSVFWFREMEGMIKNHLIEVVAERFPDKLRKYSNILGGRSMIVRKAKPFPVECVVRGYLAGSGWKDYQESGKVCGITLPAGLLESSKLEKPIFTPTTKAEQGHDMNISFEEMAVMVGGDLAVKLRDISIGIYERASAVAETRGIIVADTKFEFGLLDGEIILIDEALTPDSSRFWSARSYKPGQEQDSYDKQIVRDYLNTLDWNKQYPGPELPADVTEKTRKRYTEILEILTGKGLEKPVGS
ncbi:MAG: phosphoribosylaminoimidazolesuccinocarboxamide synthase [Syntrophobacterales bacterium]|jgi:phosphoribosylaminoimidazole-succinocarboxamide synthase|nr:phosphoribosylaminoimidazolesuccinocarboxamide synthase [Syntrophobacterales bacterium]